MITTPRTTATSTFDFDFFRFNGKGNRPIRVSTPQQADFMRSRYSVEENLVNAAIQRVVDWSKRNSIGVRAERAVPLEPEREGMA